MNHARSHFPRLTGDACERSLNGVLSTHGQVTMAGVWTTSGPVSRVRRREQGDTCERAKGRSGRAVAAKAPACRPLVLGLRTAS